MSTHGTTKQYAKPALERFGTLRELTQAGTEGTGDGVTVFCYHGGRPY